MYMYIQTIACIHYTKLIHVVNICMPKSPKSSRVPQKHAFANVFIEVQMYTIVLTPTPNSAVIAFVPPPLKENPE